MGGTESGRLSLYDPAFAEQARMLCELGAIDEELADFFGIEVRTVHRWKHDHPEFRAGVRIGKDAADDRVERSLYQRAVGYEREQEKVFMPPKADAPVRVTLRVKVPPDVKSAIFWLKNRRPNQWRDRREVEHIGESAITRIERVIVDTAHRDDPDV